MRENIDDIKAALVADLPRLLQTLFRGKKMTQGHGAWRWRIGTHGSLAVRVDGVWSDKEGGEGGDVIALITFALATDFKGALAFAKSYTGGAVVSVPWQTQHESLKAQRADRRKKIRRAQKIWSQSRPYFSERHHIVGRRYLALRGLLPNPWPEDMRFHFCAYNFTTEKRHTSIVCAVRDVSGEVIAVHQTFLTSESKKISGDGVKARLLHGAVKGGAIRLASATNRVALAEGVEDALSVIQCTPWPCWATGGASNIPDLPEAIREVLLCPDNDAAGHAWAQKAGKRYTREGRTAKVAMPPHGAKDWNEALQIENAAMSSTATQEHPHEF